MSRFMRCVPPAKENAWLVSMANRCGAWPEALLRMVRSKPTTGSPLQRRWSEGLNAGVRLAGWLVTSTATGVAVQGLGKGAQARGCRRLARLPRTWAWDRHSTSACKPPLTCQAAPVRAWRSTWPALADTTPNQPPRTTAQPATVQPAANLAPHPTTVPRNVPRQRAAGRAPDTPPAPRLRPALRAPQHLQRLTPTSPSAR